MAEQELIQFHVDKNLKDDVEDICEALGIDMATVFRMLMKRIKMDRGIPFPTTLPETAILDESERWSHNVKYTTFEQTINDMLSIEDLEDPQAIMESLNDHSHCHPEEKINIRPENMEKYVHYEILSRDYYNNGY